MVIDPKKDISAAALRPQVPSDVQRVARCMKVEVVLVCREAH